MSKEKGWICEKLLKEIIGKKQNGLIILFI